MLEKCRILSKRFESATCKYFTLFKIGIITDIHNNLHALNAVLDKFYSMGVKKIICSGDLIGIGPKP